MEYLKAVDEVHFAFDYFKTLNNLFNRENPILANYDEF